MKKSLLDILACPGCRFPLELSVFAEEKPGSKPSSAEIVDGLLQCRKCAQSFPVIHGIPRFVPNAFAQHSDFVEKYPQVRQMAGDADFAKMHGDTQERFGFEWMNYPGPMPEDRPIFLDETQIPTEEWRDKRILDGGCGMGRYSRVAHELGAHVVAMDLSQAVIRLSDVAKNSDRMHLIQGNLFQPPFRDGVFDIAYSIGVIHHTPNARTAFDQLSRVVKPGGRLSVWVYGTAGAYEQFKTNPLRADRKGLDRVRFLVWLTVLVREFLSDSLRRLTVHLPHRLVYAVSYPLALVGKIPFVKYLTFSVHPLWRVRLQENFDWLAPPYQSHHTKEELIGWFQENKFEVLSVLPHGFVPKPGVLGRKK